MRPNIAEPQRNGKIIGKSDRDISEMISILFIFALVASVGALGLFYAPVADDYGNAAGVRAAGLFGYVVNLYSNWSGRLFSSFLIGLTFRNYEWFSVSSCILALSFMLIPIIVGMGCRENLKKLYTTLVIVLSAYLFGFRTFLAETVYWPTGGWVYVFCFFAYAVWLLGYYRALENSSIKGVLLLFLTGLVLGTAHEQLSFPFCFLALYLFIGKLRLGDPRKEEGSHKDILFALPIIALIIGTVILVVAPGNYLRAQAVYTSEEAGLRIGLISIVRNILSLLKTQIYAVVLPLIGSFVAGILAGIINAGSPIPEKYIKKTIKLVSILLVSALLTLIPLIPFPKFAEHRTQLFAAVFLFAAMFTLMKTLTEIFIDGIMKGNQRISVPIIAASTISLLVLALQYIIRIGLETNLRIVAFGLAKSFGIAVIGLILSMAVMLFLMRFCGKLMNRTSDMVRAIITNKAYQKYLRLAVVVLMAIFASVQIIPQYRSAIPYKVAGDARNVFMEAIKDNYRDGSTVEIPPYSAANPTWFHFSDITNDPKNWINQGVSRFYQLDNRKIKARNSLE